MFLLFFLIIDLYFLLPTVIAQIFHLTAEFVIPVRIPTKSAKEEVKKHPVNVEAKKINYSIQFKIAQTFFCFLLFNLFWSVSLMKQFLVSSIFFNLNSWLMFSIFNWYFYIL